MKPLHSQNYYEILGVHRSATGDEIRKAYELSKVTYQDNSLATYSLFSDEENQEILGLISRAYETLFNPQMRKEYDDFLAGLSDKAVEPGLPHRPTPSAPGQPSPQQTHLHLGGQPPAPPPRHAPRDTRLSKNPAAEGQTPTPRAPADQPPANTPPAATQDDKAVKKYLDSVTNYTGPVLKKVRQLRGYSLEDIAERTKIRRTYIEYLEEGEFTFLPAPVYVKGFITLIARVLDLPPHEVAEDYMTSYYQAQQP